MKSFALKVGASFLFRHAPLAAGVMTTVLGATGLALWHLQASLALAWAANIEAMPHHASSALLLCGLALGASTFGATRLTRSLAALGVLLTLGNLAGQLFGLPDFLQAIFAERYGRIPDSLSWTIPMSNAVAFLLAGFGLLLASEPRLTRRLRHGTALVAVLSFVVSLLTLVGRATPSSTQETHSLSLIPALALGQLLLAAGLVCFAYRRNRGAASSPLGWIATVVVVGQMALTLLLWNGLELIIEARQSRLLAAETAELGEHFTGALRTRVRALEHMARRWEVSGGTSRALWTVDAAAYVADLEGFQALQWVDASGRVKWVVPERGNEAAIDLDNSHDPVRQQMLSRARATPTPIVTGPIDLVQGGRGLLITRALTVNGAAAGYIVGVFRVDEFLQPLTQEISALNFGLEVTLGGETVFRNGADAHTSLARAQTRNFVVNGDSKWQFRIWPGDGAVQRGPFSDLFLASGIAMTLLVAVAFSFWGRNAHAARKLKEANLALSAERNFVTGLIDNTDALSIVFDPEGRIVRFNRACEALTGYTADEILGKRLWDVAIPAEEVDYTRESFERLLMRAKNGRFEGTLVAKDGRSYRIAWSNSVLAGSHERPKYVMSVGIDVTERKRVADALIEAKDEADRANRAKSDFLSSMSHELRTPMNAVLGFAQLIAMDPQLPGTHRESVEQILKAGDLLLHLINDILNLSRIESGRIELAPETVSCGELIAECISMVSPLAQRNGVRVESSCDAGIVVQADRQFMKQIVLNLLSNAIKYNRPAGEVRVHSELGLQGQLRITVSDTGQGILPEMQAHLFEPFNRLGAQNGSIEGTGIGLVVCKRLIEAMGGDIRVVSDHGRGSAFTITLPGASTTGADGPDDAFPVPAAPVQHKRLVLLIGQSDPTQRLLQKILATLPDVQLTYTARVDQLPVAYEALTPDLVIVDVSLPGSNMAMLVDAIRKHPLLHTQPIIALGTGNTERDAAGARAAGFCEYLGQPLDVAHVRQVATRVLRHADPAALGGAAPDVAAYKPIMTP